ncbi:hypothetical protein [Psychroserpens sp. SPM9]|uniref:hypothetical protein n=1 Tax=Psychroserpens sp. SPM9 TaxID=2975598 RepID=UPI0021A77D8E|nr:hypothetical protein [Psychroserpens sp. SPM9]MDG5490685.1 hypothetical protein [Psychroserpens sp. SPM9]
MMKSIFFTAIITLMSFNVFAQDAARQNLTSPGMIYSFDMNDNSIKGTPYIVNEFMPGKISIDEQSKIYNLRYNAFNDVIEIERSNGDLEALNKDLSNVTITFTKDNKSYRAYNYIDPDTNNNMKGYFVVVSDNKKPLLVKERIVFTEKKQAKSSYDKTKPAQYKRKSDLYFTLNSSGVAVEIPSNKKDVANLFPEHSKDILNFIKSNKIKTSKQEDLVQLLNYMSTL